MKLSFKHLLLLSLVVICLSSCQTAQRDPSAGPAKATEGGAAATLFADYYEERLKQETADYTKF